MKSKSNPDFLKKDRSSVSRQLRNIRSKVSSDLLPRDDNAQHSSLVEVPGGKKLIEEENGEFPSC